MNKIAVFTGTRAEYGLLYPILKRLKRKEQVELQLYVGGTHLSETFGYTVNRVIDDGFEVTERMDFLQSDDSPIGINQSMAKAQVLAAKAFNKYQPDIIILLGDRFEALAVAQAAAISGVPIAHIHGGELTEGALDDAFRHAITKLAHIHFTSTEEYRQRVIQLGEQPKSVFNVGAPGVDNIKHLSLLTREELINERGNGFSSPFFLITFHPETLAEYSPQQALNNLLHALDRFETFNLIITYPNADAYGRSLIEILKSYAEAQPERVYLFESIGLINYLSAMKYATAVIGNSSSGIIEAPSFHVPTVNIGNRQKGRIASKCVLHCSEKQEDIFNAIKKATSPQFKNSIAHISNPYGDGNASERIVDLLIDTPRLSKVKSFYDLADYNTG